MATNRYKSSHFGNGHFGSCQWTVECVLIMNLSVECPNEATVVLESVKVCVANFLVEFKNFKFRLTLPSRKRSQCENVRQDSMSILHSPVRMSAGNHFHRILGVINRGSVVNVAEMDQAIEPNTDYVYLREDLLQAVYSLLELNDEDRSEAGHVQSSFRCLIYNNDFLCYNLLFRDGVMMGNTAASVSTKCSTDWSTIPDMLKVYDQSVAHLFREAHYTSINNALIRSKAAFFENESEPTPPTENREDFPDRSTTDQEDEDDLQIECRVKSEVNCLSTEESTTEQRLSDQAESSSSDKFFNATELNKIVTVFKDKPLKSLIKYIKTNLLLKKSDVSKRKQLIQQIETTLCNNGLNCKMYIFGSTKTWLGLRSLADIDVFSQIRDRNNEPIDEMELSYTDIEKVLRKIASIINRCQASLGAGQILPEVICHPHMRVPITRLRVFPNTTESSPSESEIIDYREPKVATLQCDINVNNALGIANTRFIQFLCKFEPRFFVLSVLIRLWVKYVAIINKPTGLTSYAAVNLVLFFFQKRTPPILPPVDYFIKLSSHPKIVNNWRCDFCKDLSRIDFQSANTETVFQLLIGFFRFYDQFEFDRYKISVRYAKAWKLRRPSRGKMRPVLVHLMDPFEQSHNLTARFSSKLYKRTKNEFRIAINRYSKYLQS